MSQYKEKNRTSLSTGLLWATVAVFFGKICTLLSQLVGGFFLSAEDYGTIAFVVSLLSFIAIFYNYGLDSYLIQKHKDWKETLPTIWKISISMTCFSVILGLSIAFFFLLIRSNVSLFWTIIAGVASFPFAAFFPLYKAEHAVAGNYIYQSTINATNSIVNMTCFILLMLLGLGPISFFLGALLGNITSYFLFRRDSNKIRDFKHGNFNILTFNKIINDLRFAAIGYIFNSFALRIDYLILGFIASSAALGHYFFGFSLTGVLALLFTTGIQGILMPDLVHKISDQKIFRDSMSNIEFSTLYISGILALCFIFILPDFLYIVWGSRWDKACFVALILCLAMPIAICRATILVALDASGKWKEKAALNGINCFTVALFTWIGWETNELVGVTISIILQRIFFGVAAIVFVNSNLLKMSVATSLMRIIRYSIPFLSTCFLGWLLGHIDFLNYSNDRGVMTLITKTPIMASFFIGYIAIGYIIAPSHSKSIAHQICKIFSRILRPKNITK